MIQYTAPFLLLAVAATSPVNENTRSNHTPTIEEVAREYRIQTYDNFRTLRGEYNRRIEIGKLALDRYAEANDARQQEILGWFAQSKTGDDTTAIARWGTPDDRPNRR